MHYTTFVSSALCASVAVGAALPSLDLSSVPSTTSTSPQGGSGGGQGGSGGGQGGYNWGDVGPGSSWSDKCGYITQDYAEEVINQFTTDGIIPDLIEGNVFWHPTVEVNVAYGDKVDNLGTYYTTEETINAPTLNFTAEKDFDPYTTKYIYFLLDPDVPEEGSPVQVTFEHWAVANAQPYCVTDQQPETLVIYEPLTPASTTQHRYTFLVYRQPEDFDPSAVQLQLQLRTPFDINDFAETYNLTVVGGNFLKEAIVNGLQDGTGLATTPSSPLPTL